MVILRFTLNCWDGKWLMSSREVNVMQSSQGIGIMNKPIKADMWVYALSFLTVFFRFVLCDSSIYICALSDAIDCRGVYLFKVAYYYFR